MLTVGSLFAGIGGFDLGLERAGMRVAWQSEIDPWASAVLRKHWPSVLNHGDIRGIRAGTVEPVDASCGGLPCQPFSHAGKRGGESDDRYLWPEMLRVIDALRPAWVIAENVVGIINMALDKVLSDLEAIGYTTRPIVIPAVAVDAPHRRDRVWIIARDARRLNADRNGRYVEQECAIRARRTVAVALRDRDRDREPACAVDAEVAGMRGVVADTDDQRSQGREREGVRERADEFAARTTSPPIPNNGCWRSEGARPSVGRRQSKTKWLPEPNVGRVAYGVPRRVDRLKCLGNAIVPQIAEVLGRAIIAAEMRAAE